MQEGGTSERPGVTRTPTLPDGVTSDDARDSVLSYYARDRSSYGSDDFDLTKELSDRKTSIYDSIYAALRSEDKPDPKLELSRPSIILEDAEAEESRLQTVPPIPVSESAERKGPVPPARNISRPLGIIGSPFQRAPPRPPRPRNNSSGSWLANGSSNPWVDISLDGPNHEKAVEHISGAHRRSQSAAPSSRFPVKMANYSCKSVDSDRSSLEKGKFFGPPKPVNFWHRSIKMERRSVSWRWCLMTGILSVFILGILSLYWGVLWNVDDNLTNIKVIVVNFETAPDALVGPVITGITEQIVRENQEPHLGFETVFPFIYNNDHMAVREAIWQEEAWAAIVVNRNATQMLRQAVGFGNSSYDPTGAIQIIYNEARGQDLYFDHIYPMMDALQTQIVNEFGRQWTAEIMANPSLSKANLAMVPHAVNPAIGFAIFNLRPFLPHTAIPAVSIGLIYLIIISFFSFSFYLPIHMRFMKGPGHPPVKFWQWIIWRWTATIMAYFVLSLAYSLVSLAFQIPFNNYPGSHYFSETAPSKFGSATFVVFWMINFLGMSALGLACENMAMFLGMPWTALWLIFWVITNVSTAFYQIEVEHWFYRWGYAWPLHNIVEASRTVLFDLKSDLGLNLGILGAWIALSSIIFPFACLYMKWKTGKMMAKQAIAMEKQNRF